MSRCITITFSFMKELNLQYSKLDRHYGPGVNSASNRNEYQEYFLGEKVAVCKADNIPPSCAVVTKSGRPNFLEPCGPVQACNGTALPFTLSLQIQVWAVMLWHWIHAVVTKVRPNKD